MRINNIFSLNCNIYKLNTFLLNNTKIEFFIGFLNIIKSSLIYIFKTLIDIFVTDYLYFSKRFRICYNLCSDLIKNKIITNYSLKLLQSYISIYIIFKCSIWAEREVYDMFGIKFINNWDLRRILTDYTFFGFPLRKDFPVSGYVELSYDERKKTTGENLIELMQEMRFFFVSSFVEFWDYLK